ncbi:MAG TPA: hypothetical protein VGS19_01170 [Streptosporangiaceae bacterium]|nr:hypothetical protein [Streptosporangiaceae bacterium]
MPQSPYATEVGVLRADAVMLEGALALHGMRHGGMGGCPVNGKCDAWQAMQQALNAVLARLARAEASGTE